MKLHLPIAPILLSCAFIFGCTATRQPEISADKANQIIPNISTSTDVYRAFGQPQYEKLDYNNNTKFWTYHIRRSNTGSKVLASLVGAGAGVAIGNQIGKGNGRKTARIVGGLAGAAIAHSTVKTKIVEKRLVIAISTKTNLVIKKDYEENRVSN